MDWSKAKNVLIVIFLALNVFLLFTNYDTLSSGRTVSKEILSNTESVLNSRGVKLKCKYTYKCAKHYTNIRKY
jgi:regulatory protein YycI of two-component signal transduction system YycFG